MVMIRRKQLVETLIFFGLFTVCMSSAQQNRILRGGRGGHHLHPHPHPSPNPNPLTSYARDAIALLTVKESLSSTTNPALSTWGLATPLCQWDGVTWSHESNAQFDCTTELWSGSFTHATDLGAVATSLVLQSANLDGTLSPAIANLNQLTVLILNNNSLKGFIPWELGNSPSLGVVSLSHNHITGPMPASIWNLCRTSSKLTTLILEFNNITGHIPEPLGGEGMTCPDLTSLDVSNNFLSGSIPAFIANFASLSQLDLSNNLFTYVIPLEFARLTNLSTGPDGFSVANNHLMGPIPPFHRWFDESAFVGNSPLLCGLPLQPCVDPGAHHHARRRGLSPTGMYVIIAAVIMCVVMVTAICIGIFSGAPAGLKERVYLLSGEGKLVEEEIDGGSKGKLVRFEGCGEELTEEAVLNASTELLEVTSYGTIYRAWLPTSRCKQMVSLRLFQDSMTKDDPEFAKVVRRLALINHPNLVPLRAYYLSDRNEKVLISDYSNGHRTLADVLHGTGAGNDAAGFEWHQRHKIALKVAQALKYLHCELPTPIVHANLKSSTVLLDAKFNPLLTGYGLHLLVTVVVAKTIVFTTDEEGYNAPELKKLKRASTRTDVFSFGVILLEILTRRRSGKVPRTGTYIDLPTLVKAAVLEERLSDVLDGELLQPSICTPTENGLLQTLRLAMGCCAPSPSLRPTITEIVHNLEDIQCKILMTYSSVHDKSPSVLTPDYKQS